MKFKTFVLIAGCIMLLCGCTKSNIIHSEETMGPDFNLYSDIEIDPEQLHNDVLSIYNHQYDTLLSPFEIVS